MTSPRLSVFAPLLALAALTGCGHQPRFGTDIASGFAHAEMRKLESEQVELYYPADQRETAVRTLGRLDQCLAMIRKLPITRTPRGRAVVYMTPADFNNAYVYPPVGEMEHMVLPQHLTLELFNWFEFGLTDVGDISCHEAIHYVQMEQTDGFWWLINLLGGNLYAPNAGIETWFLEGLATYYEGRLGHGLGRSHSPIWRGMFMAGIASRDGEARTGDLSPDNRELLPFGGNYLAGMHFVEHLANKYGEEKLWQLIDDQGRSIFSPILVTQRFRTIYGSTIGGLFDDWRTELFATVKPRPRPAEQKVVDPDAGYLARIAASRADGALAELTAQRDEPVKLTVREANGTVRFSRGATPILPGRPYIISNPVQASGLSFSPDGKALYAVLSDYAADTTETARLLEFDARTGDLLRRWDLGAAMGGSATPDGKGYLFVQVVSQTADLIRLDLATGQRTPLTHFPHGTNLGGPEMSPDGKRILFARQTVEGYDLALREEDGSIVALTHDATFDYFPHWVDDGQRVTFLREVGGEVQVFQLDVGTRDLQQVTRVPFTVMDPVSAPGGRVLFLNREGWGWTVDEVPLPPMSAKVATPEADPSEEFPLPSALGTTPPAASGPDTDTPTAVPVAISSDSAYSQLDHLFVPVLRVPYILPSFYGPFGAASSLNLQAAVSLTGSDRLGFHSWALDLAYGTLDTAPSVAVSYGNHQLAPWFLAVQAARTQAYATTEWRAVASASRPFWTTPLTFAFEALDRIEHDNPFNLNGRVRLVGPSVAIDYSAGEGTPYAGTRLGLALSASATAYPSFLGSTANMADLRAGVAGFVPLPLLKRQTLRLSAIGRYLPGAPTGLLQVGGLSRGVLSYNLGGTPSSGPEYLLPTDVSFVEPLRGYEDHPVFGTSAVIVGARYKYPFIIDRGTASILWLFPSLFVRQIDVEVFGEGALVDGSAWHRSAGAMVALRMVVGSSLPVMVYAQVAHRFDDNLSNLPTVGLALE